MERSTWGDDGPLERRDNFLVCTMNLADRSIHGILPSRRLDSWIPRPTSQTDQVHGLPVPILRSALKAMTKTVTNGAGRENEARRRGSR